MSPQLHSLAAGVNIGAVLGALHTADLRAIAAAAIDLLDERVGDIDLEDDDPAGDTLDEHGEHPTDDATTMLATKPLYGIDQTHGPLNGEAAKRDHHAIELGLVRNARGSWSFPS